MLTACELTLHSLQNPLHPPSDNHVIWTEWEYPPPSEVRKLRLRAQRCCMTHKPSVNQARDSGFTPRSAFLLSPCSFFVFSFKLLFLHQSYTCTDMVKLFCKISYENGRCPHPLPPPPPPPFLLRRATNFHLSQLVILEFISTMYENKSTPS